MVLSAIPAATQPKGAYRFETVKESDCLSNRRKNDITVQYKNYLAVTTKEEYYNEANEGVSKKAYNQKIESADGRLENEVSTSPMSADSTISISDLFSLVKQYEKAFRSKPINSMLKVLYRGVKKQPKSRLTPMWNKATRTAQQWDPRLPLTVYSICIAFVKQYEKAFRSKPINSMLKVLYHGVKKAAEVPADALRINSVATAQQWDPRPPITVYPIYFALVKKNNEEFQPEACQFNVESVLSRRKKRSRTRRL